MESVEAPRRAESRVEVETVPAGMVAGADLWFLTLVFGKKLPFAWLSRWDFCFQAQ